MINKFIGINIIGLSVILIAFIIRDDFKQHSQNTCIQLTPSQQLTKLIKDDFQTLYKDKQLPEEWNLLSNFKININSNLARILLGKANNLSFPINKTGNFQLEIEMLDLPDTENPGIIIQASIYNINSKNKIFEISRAYTMSNLNK